MTESAQLQVWWITPRDGGERPDYGPYESKTDALIARERLHLDPADWAVTES